METLVVKNFLVVKEANLDVKKFNIIIGSQGTGKSVLAKTLYLLKNLENLIRSHLIKGTDFEVLNKEIKNKFISIFPSTLGNLKILKFFIEQIIFLLP
jgi:predicted ATPase